MDVERQRVEVYRQPDVESAAYSERTTVQPSDVLTSQAVPGLSIPLKDIW
jgi:Uma2 family endonuclease